MSDRLPFLKYTLRSRLLFFGGATFLLCGAVILLFFPLLNITLDGLLDRSIRVMQEEQGVEATTIARLMVLEFSQLKDLMQVSPDVERPVDEQLKNLLWEKVTFNEIIQGIELIKAPGDAQGQHLTYLFYRQEAPELKPMDGPQKSLKKFTGLEKDLMDSISARRNVDKALLESINRGPKSQGDMLLRYMPLHVLLPEEGAIYWGVAKIGISTARMTQMLKFQSQEQDRVRHAIWLEIVLTLTIAGLIALGLVYLWTRNLTRPLKDLSIVAGTLQTPGPRDFDLWVDNLKRVDPQGQAEVADLKQTLMALGGVIPKISRRLLIEEHQACWGRVAARVLPVLKALSEQLPTLEGPARQEISDKLKTAFDDLHHFRTGPDTEWQPFDLTPGLNRAWRLATTGLPPEVELSLDLEPLPALWGSPGGLQLACLYLLDYAVGQLPPAGNLILRARPLAPEQVQIDLQFAGPPFSTGDCEALLNPFKGAADLQASLGPALAAAIAAQHGGSLQIHPLKPGGLLLQLMLPTETKSHGTGQS